MLDLPTARELTATAYIFVTVLPFVFIILSSIPLAQYTVAMSEILDLPLKLLRVLYENIESAPLHLLLSAFLFIALSLFVFVSPHLC